MRRVFKILKKQVDYAEYGGAPLLGVKKCTIICHGKSNKIAIKNAMEKFEKEIEKFSWKILKKSQSKITGKEGNKEFFYYLKKG